MLKKTRKSAAKVKKFFEKKTLRAGGNVICQGQSPERESIKNPRKKEKKKDWKFERHTMMGPIHKRHDGDPAASWPDMVAK